MEVIFWPFCTAQAPSSIGQRRACGDYHRGLFSFQGDHSWRCPNSCLNFRYFYWHNTAQGIAKNEWIPFNPATSVAELGAIRLPECRYPVRTVLGQSKTPRPESYQYFHLVTTIPEKVKGPVGLLRFISVHLQKLVLGLESILYWRYSAYYSRNMSAP